MTFFLLRSARAWISACALGTLSAAETSTNHSWAYSLRVGTACLCFCAGAARTGLFFAAGAEPFLFLFARGMLLDASSRGPECFDLQSEGRVQSNANGKWHEESRGAPQPQTQPKRQNAEPGVAPGIPLSQSDTERQTHTHGYKHADKLKLTQTHRNMLYCHLPGCANACCPAV